MNILRAALLVTMLQTGEGLRGQVIALDVAGGSEAAKAGIQSGDVLSVWKCGADGGEIRNPFDAGIVEMETAGRGPVTLSGSRAGVERTWTLNAYAWGLPTAPSKDGRPPAGYVEGQRLAATGQLAEAAALWERSAGQATGMEAAWLLSRAGETFGSARQLENSDRAFAGALRQN